MTLQDTPSSDKGYEAWLKEVAMLNQFDGCTGVSEVYRICCLQHDFAYHSGFDALSVYLGSPQKLSRRQADAQFKACNQEESFMKRWSPIALFRWIGVRAFGWALWGDYHDLQLPNHQILYHA